MLLLLLISSLLFNNNSLDKKVESYLSKHLADYAKFEFEILSSPDSYSNIEFRNDMNFSLNKNMVYIPVTIVNAKNSSSSSYLSVKVKLYKNVLVATKSIKAKTDLDIDMFDTKLMDVTALRGKPLESFDGLKFLRSKLLLNKGEILTEEEVESLPILFSGDEVTAIKIIGSVTITVQAIARQDGCVGERIKIKTIDNKQFIAKVANKKKVFIEE